MLRNEEGYTDPTADGVMQEMARKEREKTLGRIKIAVHMARDLFGWFGFEIEERIVLRDKRTGKVWR